MLHTPAAPSGLRLMQMVGGGTGQGLFAPAAGLSIAGVIIFLVL